MSNGATDSLPGIAEGLSETEAAARLRDEGPNELPRPDRRTPVRILVDVVREPMFALLLGAGAIYLLLGDLEEALILLVFATASVSIAVVQETRTERVLEALRDLTSPRALVVRGGVRRRIPGREVVRGDRIVLAEGDRVPADAVVLRGHDLQSDESLLTGESVPVRKSVSTGMLPSARPGGDDLPFVFSGSLVVSGEGLAEVTATGARSEIGKIGAALGRIESEPPRLRVQTRRLVRAFATVSLSFSAVVILLYGLWRGSWLEALLGGIAISMSMLPEEFPLVLTVFTVMGAWRIAQARVLTRRVAAIETIGAVTVLCTDKTGTLTQNRMTIAELRAGDEVWRPGGSSRLSPPLRAVLEYGILASDQDPFDPMEQAFHRLGREHIDEAAYAGRHLVHQYGLRPDLLAVTNVWEQQTGDEELVAAKGAPEAIAVLCRLSDAQRRDLRSAVEDMARRGMRVLGVAAATSGGACRTESPRDFTFGLLGLVGLADPLRPAVPEAVRECRSAGIRVVMITGDYPATARAIARQAGVDADDVVAGDEVDRMSDEALARRVRTATVFARVMPAQKLRIVEALKADGEVVGMTGDGVNDAPSLKAAHIGIAMGRRGTDVAREAASIVLLDDDFGSIVKAVRLGRRIYDNLRKAMGYILAVHVPIAGLALLPLLFGLPLAFTPIHIAFLEMVIDPVCSIVFEAESEEGDIMHRAPRDPDAPLFRTALVGWSLLQGLVVLALVAVVFIVAVRRGLPDDEARSLAFATLVATNFGLVLVNRSFSASLVAAFRQPNGAIWWVLGTTAAILGAAFLVPPLRDLFRFGALHGHDLAIALLAGLVALLVLEAAKRPFWRLFGESAFAKAA
jgi:Ca2+-transporting ATPase